MVEGRYKIDINRKIIDDYIEREREEERERRRKRENRTQDRNHEKVKELN
jgi:hypothetical protein